MTHSMWRAPTFGAIAVALVATAACGSTVQLTSTGVDSSLGGPTLVPSSAPSTGPQAPGGAGVVAPDGSGGQAGVSSQSPGVGLGTGGGTDGSRAAPGASTSTVTVGIGWASGSGSFNSALGLAGTDPGDLRLYYNAAIDDVNRNRGIQGRRITPLYFDLSNAGSSSADGAVQAACTNFTQDHKVFAVLGIPHPVMRGCTRKAGVLDIVTSFSQAVPSTFTDFPNYFEVSTINLVRIGPVSVDGLAKTDYFSGKPVIGLVTWDDPQYREGVQAGWLPALRAHGLAAKDVAFIAPPATANDVGTSGAAVKSAVLKFFSDGVDHVMIADGPAGILAGTGLTLLFIHEADTQGYFPRYGMNSTNSPVAGYDAGLWSSQDLRGARGVVWSDADPSAPSALPNAARAHCLQVMQSHQVRLANVNARSAALNACDEVFFLRAAVAEGKTGPSLSATIAGANSLGWSYVSPRVYATRFGRDRHDGASAARLISFDSADSSCGKSGCWKLQPSSYRLP